MKNKKNKEYKKKLREAKEKSPEHVDWKMCTEVVDSLHQWIEELCLENHNLKKILKEVTDRIQKDNETTKKLLAGINLPDLDSMDTQDH